MTHVVPVETAETSIEEKPLVLTVRGCGLLYIRAQKQLSTTERNKDYDSALASKQKGPLAYT